MAKAKSKPKTKIKKSEKHAHYEALGVALFALGVLLLLALGWPRVVTGRNPIGPVGALLDSWFLAAFGGFGFLVAIPAFAWGLDSFGVIRRSNAARASAFAVVLLVFLPTLTWLLNPEAGGKLGTAVGPLLVSGFGTLGAILIVAAVLLIASVLTLELSVARAIGRIFGVVWTGLKRLVILSWRALRRIGSWLAAVVEGFRRRRMRPASWMRRTSRRQNCRRWIFSPRRPPAVEGWSARSSRRSARFS
jgi:hypothetical protein